MLLLSPRLFHSSFIHSTGTSGLPFCTAPQQHPRQSATWATRTRFVCMEKVVDGTTFDPSSCKYPLPWHPSQSARREGAATLYLYLQQAQGETRYCTCCI